MFLSRIALNPARREGRKLLASPQAMHAAVLSSFAPGSSTSANSRVLWRLDRQGPEAFLYVVSPAQPDFAHLVEQAGWPTTETWVSKPYTPLLAALSDGQHWHFRLTANPVHKVRIDGETRATDTKLRAHVSAGHQLEWLRSRTPRLGFEFAGKDDAPDVTVLDRKVAHFKRGEGKVTLAMATYEGTLVVSDAKRLREVLVAGIGRAKGYGCGLLTLAPVP